MCKKVFLLIIVSAFFCSCNNVSSDCTGTATYYIKNNTSKTLTVVIETNPNSSKSLVANVNPDEKKFILEDSGIGVNPTPEISLKSINVYSDSGFSSILYTQNPINDDDKAWNKEVYNINSSDYYHADYILQITE